jgi:hypothetical protein
MNMSSLRGREAPLPVPASAELSAPAVPSAAEGPSPFHRLLHGLAHEVEHGERMVRGALRASGAMGPGELLALQAGVYHYSEAVDLAAKLVDRASNGVKTVVQGQ